MCHGAGPPGALVICAPPAELAVGAVLTTVVGVAIAWQVHRIRGGGGRDE